MFCKKEGHPATSGSDLYTSLTQLDMNLQAFLTYTLPGLYTSLTHLDMS